MLRETRIVLGLVDDADERLVGFARVLTDLRFSAVVLDVIVDPECRGLGLGDVLMAAVIDHPELQDLRRGLTLKCRGDVREFYERWGFAPFEELSDAGGRGRGFEMVRRPGTTRRPNVADSVGSD